MMKLGELMSFTVVTVEPSATVAEAPRRMQYFRARALVVQSGDEVVGILTDRDIALRSIAQGLNPSVARVESVMTVGITGC